MDKELVQRACGLSSDSPKVPDKLLVAGEHPKEMSEGNEGQIPINFEEHQ